MKTIAKVIESMLTKDATQQWTAQSGPTSVWGWGGYTNDASSVWGWGGYTGGDTTPVSA